MSVTWVVQATEEERDNAVKELEKRKKVSATAATTIKALHKQVKSLEKTVEKQAHLEVEVERLTERLAEVLFLPWPLSFRALVKRQLLSDHLP
jgi:hypothetical protein